MFSVEKTSYFDVSYVFLWALSSLYFLLSSIWEILQNGSY